MKRFFKIISVLIFMALLLLAGMLVYVRLFVQLEPPSVEDKSITEQALRNPDYDNRQLGSNWLRRDETGIWEMYLEGQPFDRGYAAGKMGEDLLLFQERVFVDQVEKMVPNRMYRSFLLRAIKYYNRNLNDYVPLEYREEIYGVSRSAPSEYDDIGEKYERKLSYHAAHDIGHAFQNMGFVSGCTAFTARDSASQDLLLGRNFDFYIGDDFARNKIVLFVRPDDGYAFVSLAWPAMIGVVSGMNEHGLAVILNAGPSEMPKGVKTPVTILAREILQYAKTVAEAETIARKRDIFVSENFIVASGKENRVIAIEKSPGSTAVYENTPEAFVCTNHFQSQVNKNTEANQKAKLLTSTTYRFDRVQELKRQHPVREMEGMMKILRNTRGLQNEALGLGNECAINQLTGLHSVIFNLSKKQVHIAGVPSQIGPYLTYDLDEIFKQKYTQPQRLWRDSLPSDPLAHSIEYQHFMTFKSLAKKLESDIEKKITWTEAQLSEFNELNPDHYRTLMLIGVYHGMHGDYRRSAVFLKQALDKPIPWAADREAIEHALLRCKVP
jgi:predicted choloylglycine hydrolase